MFGQDKSQALRNSELSGIAMSPVCSGTTPRVSETESVIVKLQNSVSVLGDMVASIENKLNPITRPELPKNEEVKEPEFSTKISQEIHKAVRDIQYLSEKLRDLRERVEL